jgi:ubiquitin C-terminal hydrolase
MRGLKNWGNTCYFNTAIQCLAHVPQLSNHLLRTPYTGDCPITREYQTIVKELFKKDDSVVCPLPLIGMFRQKYKSFDNPYQHDSQEVILCLIDTFEQTLGKEFIKNIFNGEETTETTYPGGTSVYKNEFVTILFPLMKGGTVDLMDLVENKNKFQKISDYKDSDGNVHPEAETRTIVTRWPEIISFTFGMYDLKTVVKIPQTFKNKNLFAVVVHQGVVHGGHYVLAVKRHNKWYMKDDEAVVELSEPPMNGHFYMVWYR